MTSPLQLPVALTIAGSDPSGGAGLQADVKTFHQHRTYGASVVTMLTAQNTQRVSDIQALPTDFVLSQLNAVLSDMAPAAAKTGALGSSELIIAIAEEATRFQFPLVVDPVMVSKHGSALLDKAAVACLVEHLFPHAELVTPNRLEAEKLSGIKIHGRKEAEQAAEKLTQFGAKRVLIKGVPEVEQALDLFWNGAAPEWLTARKVDSNATHGSGCVLSAAIVARLAHGERLSRSIQLAKDFITRAISQSPGWGRGISPTWMHADCDA